MNKVLSVLVKIASDATLNSRSAVADFVEKSDINEDQKQAIINNDIEQLTKTIGDLPQIVGIAPLIPAEDDEPEEEESKTTKINDQLTTMASS